MSPLPRAARPFVGFAGVLRTHGFAAAPEQTIAFLDAVALLRARSMGTIRRAAHAIFGPPPERHAEFDALFAAHFLGMAGAPAETGPAGEDEEVQVHEDGILMDLPAFQVINEAGLAATAAEALAPRRFAPADPSAALRRLAREAPTALPRRRGYRRLRARSGPGLDLRRVMQDARRHDGEIVAVPRLRRRTRLRPVLLLVDVSGSMRSETETLMRFAHALVRAVPRIEVFTVGTRLTRVTRALRHRRADRALEAAAMTVPDWDGGTRLGDTLQAFLAVPRFAGFARGALVLVLSDGLERGDPAALVDAIRRLARRAWRLSWLSPLATAPGFRPQTEALRAVEPWLDDLAGATSAAELCGFVLGVEKRAA